MTKEEIIDLYFSSPQLETDLTDELKNYVITVVGQYLKDNLYTFIDCLPKIDTWAYQEYFALRQKFENENYYNWFLQNCYSKIGIKRNELNKVRYHHKNNSLAIISNLFDKLNEIVPQVTSKALEYYLLEEQKILEREIDEKTLLVDELTSLLKLKKIDVIRNIYLSENYDIKFNQIHDKETHYKLLKKTLVSLDKGELHSWNNIYTNFTKNQVLKPIDFHLPSTHNTPYDFSDYNSISYITYCRDIIEDKARTSITSLMMSRKVGDKMSNDELKILEHFKINNPKSFNAVYEKVHSEQLFKYTTYTALTSLVSMLDPLLRNISEQLNSIHGFSILIHDFNISKTYIRFKTEYKQKHSPTFLYYDDFEYIFDQLYGSSRGNLRNAIAHLDGIDLYTPLYYFDSLYLFVQNAYKLLADIVKAEKLTIALSISHDKLSSANELLVKKYAGGFHAYIMAIIYKDILSYMQEILFNGNKQCLLFFITKGYTIKFIEDNWDAIYPSQTIYKNDILLLFESLKIATEKLFVDPNDFKEKDYSETEIIKGLQAINCGEVIKKSELTINLFLSQIISNISTVCPSFKHLIIITSFGVKTKDKHEAMLNITASALIIEKILLHVKQYLKLTDCISTKSNKVDYIIKYRNMEIEFPKNSFVDDAFFEESYKFITGIDHKKDPDDFLEYKNILFTLENIRNISAHGGALNFNNNFNEIYSFLFFVLFRLVPPNLL